MGQERKVDMKTTTFVQVINEERYTVTIPENRVDSVIARVDTWNERGKFAKALETIKPFIGAEVVLVEQAEENKRASKPASAVSALIEENRSKGKFAVMDILRQELGLNKHQAYYQTRKAGL